MLQKLFSIFGLNTPRWQWRLMKWERTLKGLLRGQVNTQGISLTRPLLFLNLALFTLMVLHGLLAGVGPRVLLSPPTQLLLGWGGQFWPATINYGQWWRCLTYAYTHGGLIHLAFNMIVLYQVGPLVESELRFARFAILYTFATLTATLAALLWYPNAPIVGASGALFGLIGFSVVYFHRLGPPGAHIRNFMLQWAVFAFVFGLLVGADNAGHFGGAVGGALLGLVFHPYRSRRPGVDRVVNLCGGLCIAANLIAIGAMLLSIATG